MSYSKQELIEALIGFESEHGRYPTRQDFKAKKMKPSKNTFHRAFGGMENAIKQAELAERGELTLEDDQEIKPIKPVSKKGGFQCRFCGNWTNDADKYYSSLTKNFAMGFIKLLKSKNERNYFDGVMDSIYYVVFGGKNLVMREELGSAGYLDTFEKRYEEEEQDSGSQGYGKLRCYKCGKLKEDWDITVDTDTKFCKPICEDCLSNSKNRKRENTKK